MSRSRVPNEPNLTPEMRRFLDDLARAIDDLKARMTQAESDIEDLEALHP
jgi:ABC-type transporter Mla subunit MlaD